VIFCQKFSPQQADWWHSGGKILKMAPNFIRFLRWGRVGGFGGAIFLLLFAIKLFKKMFTSVPNVL
jgi:hypothetical protein